MKTKYLIFVALAGFALASCSNGEYLGDDSPMLSQESPGDAIEFSYTMQNATRADKYKYGADAAARLSNHFVIYGIKHPSAEDKTADNDKVVFNNFQTKWTTNTAGKTASNSSDWEYAGLQSYDATPTQQSVKYWDYSAAGGYTFTAFSSTDISYPKNSTTDKIQVTKTTSDATSLYNKGYSVKIKDGASLNNLYFSDRIAIPKTNFGGTVSFTFRNLFARARFGFYETVAGYTVKIDKFYIDEDASTTAVPATAPVVDFAKMKDAKTDGFYASLQNVKNIDNQTVNVTYYDDTDATIENRAKVTNPTEGYNYTFKQGNGTNIINKVLSTSASSPTWAVSSDNGYTPVIPFEGNTNPLLLKLDFTLTSEDGNGDVIHVRGARAIVPASCVQWKSNFAYTYIFKISDATNGTTGDVDANGDPIDPEGLKPITFDAIVVDVENQMQQTITMVSTNSVTTYAQGAIANEYTNGKPVYAVVTDNGDMTAPEHEVITPTAIGTAATQAQVYKLSGPASEAEVLSKLNGSPMSFTMTATTGGEAASIETTIPLSDSTTPAISNVKFTPSAAGTYAYVYTTTAYVAPTYTVQSAGVYDSGKTYYMKTATDVYYAVTVPSAAAFAEHKDHLYLASGGTVGVYDVKVIKVQ